MLPRTIADVLRRECSFTLEVPEGTGWLRLDCPYCGAAGNRPPAVVNHEAGWFTCHKCGTRKSASYDTSAATRFATVLRRAAWKAWRTFPGVLTLDDARSFANMRLSVYAGPDNGSCAEAGALELWQKKAESESQLDSYVMHALNCDLLDYGRSLIRQHDKRELLEGDRDPNVPEGGRLEGESRLIFLADQLDSKTFDDWEHMRNTGHLDQSRYPVLYATKVDGMTLQEVADALCESLSTTRRRAADERESLAAEFYGSPVAA